MLPTRSLAAVVAAVCVIGCSTVEVSSDYDPAADFTALKTYDWLPGLQAPSGDPRVDNTLLDTRVRRAVDRELAARGFRKAPGEPDFYVAYHAAVATKLNIQAVNTAIGYRETRWGWQTGSTTYVNEYDEGSLILDVIDTRTKQLLWRGSAKAQVYASDKPERREERVNEAVARLLERFPPKR